MDDIHKSGIVKGLQNLLTSSEYSDLIIRSGSEEFKVHRAIICPRSKFFAAACKGLFQVCCDNTRSGTIWSIMLINVFQEGETGIITLQDDDTPTVRRMLKYLYTLDYDDKGEAASVTTHSHGKGASESLQAATVTYTNHNSFTGIEMLPVARSAVVELSEGDVLGYHELLNNVAVYAIADKYDIPELETLAAKKFNTALRKSGGSGLVSDMASVRAVIDAVFNTTPDTKYGLRSAMFEFCEYWKEEIIDNEDSAAIVKDYGEIGLAMIRELFREREQHEKSTEARVEAVMVRENTLIWHIERISQAAKCMKVSDSREVQQNYIDAQHRRLRDLREAIQAAKDYSRKDEE